MVCYKMYKFPTDSSSLIKIDTKATLRQIRFWTLCENDPRLK